MDHEYEHNPYGFIESDPDSSRIKLRGEKNSSDQSPEQDRSDIAESRSDPAIRSRDHAKHGLVIFIPGIYRHLENR